MLGQITIGRSKYENMAKVEELQARAVERIFNSKEKAEHYSKEQDKKETRHLVNIGGINRSIEEWDVE